METTIKATKTLFNDGQCFTEGNTYVVSGDIKITPSLMNRYITNDLGEPHIIGSWWRNFVII
jgi:hypothetical protein